MIHIFSALLLFFFLFAVLPLPAQAHLGGGPPFLKVNGKDAQTNPYNQGSATTITISWDSPPEAYLVNEPITFEINVPELMRATTIPEDLAKEVKIRWSFASGENFEIKDTKYEEGSKLVKTFTKPGSYLVIMEAKLPADSDYILINTVQVDVRPNASYQLPTASVFLGTQQNDPSKNVLLVSDGFFDSSTKAKAYYWDLGDGRLRKEEMVTHRFERAATIGVETVFHRVIDENGFSADIGFYVSKQQEQLRVAPFTNDTTLPVAMGTYAQAREIASSGIFRMSVPIFIGFAFGVIFLVGLGWILFLKKKKK